MSLLAKGASGGGTYFRPTEHKCPGRPPSGDLQITGSPSLGLELESGLERWMRSQQWSLLAMEFVCDKNCPEKMFQEGMLSRMKIITTKKQNSTNLIHNDSARSFICYFRAWARKIKCIKVFHFPIIEFKTHVFSLFIHHQVIDFSFQFCFSESDHLKVSTFLRIPFWEAVF